MIVAKLLRKLDTNRNLSFILLKCVLLLAQPLPLWWLLFVCHLSNDLKLL